MATGATQVHVDTFETSERIRITENSGYFPVSTLTRDGAILVIYRHGAGHMGRSGHLVSIRSEDCGRTWSDPVVVVNTREFDDRNPAIGTAPDGTVVCGYYAIGDYDKESGYVARRKAERRSPPQTRAGLVISNDGGRSWEEPMTWTDQTEWVNDSPYGTILSFDDGRMAMPVYAGKTTSLIWSSDNGRSWGDYTVVADDVNETAYCVLPSGRWMCLGRSNDGHGQHSLIHWSDDGGKTWSGTTQFLENRRLPADLAVLSDGSVVAVHGYRTPPRGSRLVRSTDEGRTWSGMDLILHDKAEKKTDCGYPCVVVHEGWVVMHFYDASETPTKLTTSDGAFMECVRVREDEIIEKVV